MTTEVSRLDHVTAVEVDLDAGKVTVESTESIPEQAVIDAIQEAGYSAVAS
ncbi:heavy metal transport/detoxification protein [Aurantimicrobium minutum]|uniref:Heavy metal transport/detoxification protein n=1 Tax=Aurantimicrobium minutum TaxID=708131 RepID=A0A173LYL2_9MICO|nr:heavy metal transport/detoxification protein [Aurantimicrobium minutum]